MDSDGYPDEQELTKIREWPFEPSYKELMEFIKSIWVYADIGYFEHNDNVYTLHTGGWSGNEDIIKALRENVIFWGLCWEWSKKGGHYQFILNKPTY